MGQEAVRDHSYHAMSKLKYKLSSRNWQVIGMICKMSVINVLRINQTERCSTQSQSEGV